jgi:hypothetical protein
MVDNTHTARPAVAVLADLIAPGIHCDYFL